MTKLKREPTRALASGAEKQAPSGVAGGHGGALALEPRVNPAVLDTATWSPTAAWKQIAQGGKRWQGVRDAILADQACPAVGAIMIAPSARILQGSSLIALASLPDGQRAIISVGDRDQRPRAEPPIGCMDISPDTQLRCYAADADAIASLGHEFPHINAPRALGTIPRLGIGVRMTTAVWPGIFAAMDQARCAANTIQNSVRELNLLEDLYLGRPAPRNYACGFGTIDCGYTGSTFEGLWLSGVLAACDHPRRLRYGADADHLQVKRDDVGLARLRRTLVASRHYTFFTVDVSDVLEYAVLDAAVAVPAASQLAALPPDLLACHRAEIRIDGHCHALGDDAICRYHAKYARALDALSAIHATLSELRHGRAIDLELSIDEHPPEVDAFACLTAADELLFVLRELTRRGIPATHIAPNLGIEKGVDYRHPSGLAGLAARTRTLFMISERFGVMIDIHSADDLGPAVRETLRTATGGRVHYKISPSLQILFAEVLSRHHPGLYQRWWDDAWAYAQREAAAGAPLARRALDSVRQGRLADDPVFHGYGFAFVGRRDASGAFLHRHEFYALSTGFYSEYTEAVRNRIAGLASEILEG